VIVIAEVTVPADARVGDLNTISLRLDSADATAAGDPATAEPTVRRERGLRFPRETGHI
jgi:hypothetical protein